MLAGILTRASGSLGVILFSKFILSHFPQLTI